MARPQQPAGRALRAALAVAARARRAVQELARRHPRTATGKLVHLARVELAKVEPLLARTVRDALLASWLAAASEGAKVLPPAPAGGPQPPPLQPPFAPPPAGSAPEPEPVVRLPLIERAAEDLRRRQVLLPDDFARLDQDARRAAFTVARLTSLQAVEAVRDAAAKAVAEGTTLREFRQDVADAVEGSSLSKAHVETIFRTHTAAAYSAGQRAILEEPLVADQFPYLLWVATHDGRVRPEHLAMEKHGQGGTGVYRTDDPMWRLLYPPAGYNCRCMVIPLSLEDAARHGSPEAKLWLRTGKPPAEPDYAARPYPITPPPGWPTHERIEALAS